MIMTDHLKQKGYSGQALYITAMIDGVMQDIAAGQGGRNNALFKGVARLAGLIPHNMLNEDDVSGLALSLTSLPKREAMPTIQSAIRKGKTTPFDLGSIGVFLPAWTVRRQQNDYEVKAKAIKAAKQEQQRIEQGQRWACSLWDKAQVIPQNISYLTKTRGLKGCDFMGNIRFLPSLKYKHEGQDLYFPALIMAARSAPTAKVESCFRLYLSPDGSNKADIPKAKLAAASFKGLGHWVGNQDSDTLVICEGVENAYSLQLMRHDAPLICAAFSSANMSNITIPKGIKTVFLAGDSDKAGQAANQKTGNALFAAGYQVKTLIPPQGQDFNDLLLDQINTHTAKGGK